MSTTARTPDQNPRILEGDVVQLWGEFVGIKSYKAVLGQTIQIPHVVARAIETGSSPENPRQFSLATPSFVTDTLDDGPQCRRLRGCIRRTELSLHSPLVT